MATLNESSLQMRLEKRKGTISEVDRPLFEKQQAECITKAIKNDECPAKEKHVRRSIIGTWQERGNSMFWIVIGRQPLPSQAIMCWKALTVMHKLLREGHPNVLRDSYVYRKTLRDLLAVYKFQAGQYGTLICEYLKVLQTKIDLHHKYPGLPGSFMYSAENPVKIPGRDINDVFTFGVEMLDYQDLLLTVETSIINTLDKSRSISNIASAQCKIAPLVPILKEVAGMYDVLVQALTKLHKNLPPDTLDGLRQRFYEQHRKVKTFCMNAGGLTYVTSLTTIPSIPEHPPDFLIHKYHPKTKREEPKEEPLPTPIAQQVDERDILIEQLMKEISELREHLDVTINQGKQMEDHLRMEVLRQKEEVKRMEELVRQARQENTFLKEQLEAMKENENVNDKAKDADEKFNKLRLLYGKLRQDHIDLLRKNAEIKQKEDATAKQLSELQGIIDKHNNEIDAREREMNELKELNEQLRLNIDRLNSALEENENTGNSQVQNLLDQIKVLNESLELANSKIKSLELELEATQKNANQEMTSVISDLNEKIQKLTVINENLEKDKNKLQQDLLSKQQELENKILELTNALKASQDLCAGETAKRKHMEENLENKVKEYESKIILLTSELEKIKSDLQNATNNWNAKEIELNNALLQKSDLMKEEERKKAEESLRMKHTLLATIANECERIIKNALDIFNDPKHENGTTCSAEFLFSQITGLSEKIQKTSSSYKDFFDTNDDVFALIQNLNNTYHHLSEVLIHGKATSHMTSAADCLSLVTMCQDIGESSLKYIGDVRENSKSELVQADGSQIQNGIKNLVEFVAELIPKQSDSSADAQNIVEEEMHATEKLVQDAASRIEEMLNKSRKAYTGIQLEVNEKILETCTALMNAIRELILRAKDLQDEIVSEGRGTASVTEYYKRHHKWAEGLLSAAKSVGLGATILVDAADKVIERKGKFEELIVASHDIAASTAQLVAASRVKASNKSPRLPPLMKASKNVGTATAGVVAAVKNGISQTEDSKTMPDYSKMTLTQAKRWEMDSQVKILELESLLGKERSRLGELRKAHYQIAVELYGEDQVKMD